MTTVTSSKTLRDEFAISALTHVCAVRYRPTFSKNELSQVTAESIAHDAYLIADAMLDERAQP